MQCVILAGGLGTRLASVYRDIPKSMIDVGGRPFLEIQLALLKKSGIRDVVLCVGHLADRIEAYFGNGGRFGVSLAYSREEEGLLGTGGALKQAGPLLEREFLLMYGDSYLDLDYRPVLDYFLQVDSPLLMTVFQNDNRWVESNVVFKNGLVTGFDKQSGGQGMRYIDYGLSVFSRDILEEIPNGRSYNLDSLYQRLSREGRLAGLEVFRRFYEIGTPEGLEELRELLEHHSTRPTYR